jgi:cytochrome c2
MMSAREAGLVWTVENLDGFLVDPTRFLREFLGDDKALSTMGPRLPENGVRGLLLRDLVAFSPHTATPEDLDAVRALVSPSQRGEMFVGRQCPYCHAVIDDDGNYLAGAEYSVSGPNLFDIVGRSAASVEGFDYSEAMMSAREAGLVWTVENLDGFLVDPTRFLREFLGDDKALSNMSPRLPENGVRGLLLRDLVAFSPHTATPEDLDAVRALVPAGQ